jgi:hypothetical protein
MVPEDCIRLPSLLERVWNIKSDETYWRWKYIEPPFETMAFVTQKQDNDIVVFTGFWINEARVGDRNYPVFQVVDIMADPDYRGGRAYGRILKQIDEMIFKQKLLLYGFTNDVSHALFKKRWRGRNIIIVDVDHPVYTLVVNPGDLLKMPTFIKTGIGLVTRKMSQVRLSLAGTGEMQVEMTDDVPEDVDQLWEEVQKDYYWILKRNSTKLRWRFQKAPQGHYQIFLARVNGSLAGYMVTALAKRSNKIKGFIMDWLVFRYKPQIFNCLLNNALRWFLQENVNMVETWFLNQEDFIVKSLRSKFFVRRRQRRSFLLVCDDHKVSKKELARVENYFSTRGDSDFMGT